ncbi:MAG: ATP-binding cassette domain-containing protein [Oceanospirillaceae bacterium]|nr:ATP-binding cassette domain-containing protein [Oceanospirillaceae bacterium]
MGLDNSAIELRDLKVFGEHDQCLIDVEKLKLSSSTFNVICGPSGAGKSTLLFALAGLAEKRTGEVLWRGQNILGLSDKQIREFRRQHVGFLFQDFLLFDELNTSQNISLGAGYQSPQRRQEIAANTKRLLDIFGLSSREKHSARHLSGGERQRTAIARALVNNPDVVLADEPTASLDQSNAQLLISYLRRLAHQQGKLVVLISHDPAVQEKADRIIQIENGLIVAGN